MGSPSTLLREHYLLLAPVSMFKIQHQSSLIQEPNVREKIVGAAVMNDKVHALGVEMDIVAAWVGVTTAMVVTDRSGIRITSICAQVCGTQTTQLHHQPPIQQNLAHQLEDSCAARKAQMCARLARSRWELKHSADQQPLHWGKHLKKPAIGMATRKGVSSTGNRVCTSTSKLQTG